MAFTLPDGKVARTLTEQVKFLTDKLKDLYAEVNRLGFRIVIVDGALPLEGEPRTLYLVEVTPPDTNNYYEEYIWINDAWEMIGTTQVDLTNYVTLDGTQDITGNKTFKGNSFFAYTGDVTFASSPKFGANILPYDNNNSDIGSASYAWKDLYLAGKVAFPDYSLTSDSTYFYIKNANNVSLLQITQSGTVITSGTIRPSANNSLDFGSSSYAWKDLYLSGDLKSGTNYITLNNSYGNFALYRNNSLMQDWSTTASSIAVTFRPRAPDLDLGTSSYAWRDLFLAGNLSDGTNTATVADIAALITYAKAQGWIS